MQLARRSRREFLATPACSSSASLFRAACESLGAALPVATLAPPPTQLDSWLVVGRPTARSRSSAGKVELGTGVSTALRQIVAEELDVAVRAHRMGARATASARSTGLDGRQPVA